MAESQRVDPDLAFIRRLREAGGDTLKQCYQCATCSIVCELSTQENPFPRKEMLWAQWGLKDRLIADPDVFLCYQCNDCSKRCPRGARPGDVLAAIRTDIYRSFSVPAFMGDALSRSEALPVLLFVPAALLLALLGLQHHSLEGLARLFDSDTVTYSEFLSIRNLEALFISGNVLVFLAAFAGFARYFRSLRAGAGEGTAVRKSFFPALVAVIVEAVNHARFASCSQNRPRRTLHMLVLFGFFGAMATAGFALLFMLYWEMRHPGEHYTGLGLLNPIKWLGVGSGLAMMIGTTTMIQRRTIAPNETGGQGYADRLFVWMIFLVALTGLATWAFRLASAPFLAYPTYFIHLVVVFFLLWYMPYGKFAHMVYRGLALVWAHQMGRIAARPAKTS